MRTGKGAMIQDVADLDLPYLPMETPAFAADPFAGVAEARKQHPWLSTSKFGLVVHDYSAMNEIFRMEDKLRVPYGGIVEMLGMQGTPWGRFTEEQMIALPRDQHKLLRHAFAAKFTPRYANTLRPMMVDVVDRLLDEWTGSGAMDFEEFASHFPISVMFALVGAPLSDVDGMRDDLEAIGLAHSYELDRFPRIQEAMVRLDAYVQGLIAHRQAHPEEDNPDDLLHLLIETSTEGGIDHRTLVDLIMFFFIAGYDTTKNVLTYTMHTLLDYPEIYARCAEDHDYCRKVVEEALRWFNPGTVARIVDSELVYRGVRLPADTMLFMPLSISGRDAVSFADAQTFDPDRPIDPERRHIAFGLGKHMCLGQYIARAQLQEALHQIAQRLRNPRLTGEIAWRPFFGTWGLHGLPIAFDQPQPALEPA